MSNDARIAIGLPAHPKTKKLIRRLGEGAAWRLVCLFLWAAQNRSDGDLVGMTAEDIELAVDWAGDDGAFVAGLIEVGFLDGCEGTYCIHDWEEHNPWAASSNDRSDKARWAAMCRRYGRAGAAERMPEYAAKLPDSATSMPGALLNPASSRAVAEPDSATSMPLAGFSSAPSPSPSPSPNPRSRADAPQDAAPPTNAKPRREKSARPAKHTMPDDFGISDAVREWAAGKGFTRLDEHLEAFRAKALANGYAYADWDAAFREAIRGDWAKLGIAGSSRPPSAPAPSTPHRKRLGEGSSTDYGIPGIGTPYAAGAVS